MNNPETSNSTQQNRAVEIGGYLSVEMGEIDLNELGTGKYLKLFIEDESGNIF